MDLRKTFDTVRHDGLFKALGYHGLQPPYIALLQCLYSHQTGSVGESEAFNILRGVKQGDVLSAIFFNCVLDIFFDIWKSKLQYEGIMVEDENYRLTNTRYADDILL